MLQEPERNFFDEEQELLHILRILPCGICQVKTDERLTILYGNDFFYHIFGYSKALAEEEGFDSVKSIFYPPDFASTRKTMGEYIIQRANGFEIEHRVVHRDGEILWVLARCVYQKSSLTCVVIDITERKKMEERFEAIKEHRDSTTEDY